MRPRVRKPGSLGIVPGTGTLAFYAPGDPNGRGEFETCPRRRVATVASWPGWLLGFLGAIALSRISRPPLVLADEPTGNLDTKSAEEVFELLREINREDRTAFLIVTHDPRMAERCDRIVELVDDRIVSDKKRG
jgi:hypothetical protein